MEFGESEYWETKYQEKNELYEWYQPWSSIKGDILPLLNQHHVSEILNLGCGNSPMAIDMISDNFQRIVNIDISKSVIQQMKERYKTESRVEWYLMDCCQLDIADNSFDCVIEKGTIDALSCKKDNGKSVLELLKESYRVMRPGGIFLSFSFGKPSLRLCSFREAQLAWKVNEPIQIPKLMIPNQFYYLYVAIKPKNTE